VILSRPDLRLARRAPGRPGQLRDGGSRAQRRL